MDTPTVIASEGVGTKIIEAATASNELTIEAWVNPENTSQNGPARIVSLSANTSYRNFTLGQQGDYYNGRLRTTQTNQNGSSISLSSPVGSLTTDLTHVVYTRDASGNARMYLNGIEVATATIGGSLSNWADDYLLVLANETTGTRTWLGELHLVALYSRALVAGEVMQNFQAGSDGTQPPVASFTASPLIGSVPLTVDL